MDLFKAVLNPTNFPQQGFYNNPNTQNLSNNDKLRQQLYHCTYADDTKFVIQKSAKQVLHVYPNFQTQILQFVENGQKKRFLQLKGILQIQIRGKICKVDYNMMLPATYPKKAPYVRIINRNIQHTVDPFYKSLRSPTDPKSFILNQKLTTIKRWNQGTISLVDIIMESNQMMRQNFPFLKSRNINGNQGEFNNNMNVNPGWASLNNQGSGGSGGSGGGQWGTSSTSNNNNQFGYNNSGFAINTNQGGGFGGGNQGFNNNPNYTNQGYGINQYGGNQGYIQQPPIPFNNININQVIANGQKLSGQSKKILQKLKNQHIKAVQKIQHLQTIKICLQSQSNYLRNQNKSMSQFFKKNQNSQFNDLTQLIHTKDQKSQQILQLSSSIKARDDCISILEQRFSADQINFDQLCRLIKKIEEQKFQEKVLLVKCMQAW